MDKQKWQKKIYNLKKEQKVQIVIFGIIIILVGFVLMKYIKVDDCTIEEYTVIDQELRFDSKCKTVKCLFVEVQDKNGIITTKIFDSDIALLNKSFDINVGDKMKMKWCNIEGIGKRVRGIQKS